MPPDRLHLPAISGYPGHFALRIRIETPSNHPLGTTAMAETRKGEVTFKGNPIDLIGPKLKAGDPAPFALS